MEEESQSCIRGLVSKLGSFGVFLRTSWLLKPLTEDMKGHEGCDHGPFGQRRPP